MKIKIVSVDFQKDFTAKGGACYKPRPSVNFVKHTLIPYLEKKGTDVAEIISDYRQPRPGDRGNCCRPGEWGYESEIPKTLKEKRVWIKCMNSPIWIRNNIGDSRRKPGLPYQDSEKFTKWIKKVLNDCAYWVDARLLYSLRCTGIQFSEIPRKNFKRSCRCIFRERSGQKISLENACWKLG